MNNDNHVAVNITEFRKNVQKLTVMAWQAEDIGNAISRCTAEPFEILCEGYSLHESENLKRNLEEITFIIAKAQLHIELAQKRLHDIAYKQNY